MKTLDKISNFLKKPLIKYGLPVVAGLTIFSGCNLEKSKYDKENKQVYKDAAQLVREKGKPYLANKDFTSYTYEVFNFDSTKKFELYLWYDGGLDLNIKPFIRGYFTPLLVYQDEGANGLDKGTKKDAKKYTETLKEILHNAGVEGY